VKPPGWRKDWHIVVRAKANKRLYGFITAVPVKMKVYQDILPMVEINFLCVHKKLRDKRLAPVLIKEITRRVNLQNIWQAVYTAGRLLPKPVSICRYWHRSLSPKKLIDVGFSYLARNMTMSRTIKLYALPAEPQTKGLRRFKPEDAHGVTKLLNEYLDSTDMHPIFEEHEIVHYMTHRPDVVDAYVRTNEKGEVTDFLSWFNLPSTILNNAKYTSLKAAYSFYNVATSISFEALIKDLLVLAKKADFDVLNCLDVMDNETILKELKFGKGDGNLQYYLYNWRCPAMESKKVGLVLM